MKILLAYAFVNAVIPSVGYQHVSLQEMKNSNSFLAGSYPRLQLCKALPKLSLPAGFSPYLRPSTILTPTCALPRDGSVVDIGGVWLPRQLSHFVGSSPVPSEDTAQLVQTPTVKEVLTRLAVQWRTGSAALLEGPTSAGKTSYIKYLSYLTNSPYRRINLSNSTDVHDLIGRWIAGEERYSSEQLAQMNLQDLRLVAKSIGMQSLLGDQPLALAEQIYQAQMSPHWEDGPVVQAMRRGEVLLLDEINLARPQVIEALNSLFDKGFLTLDDNRSERVGMHPFTRIFATMNPSSYLGRKELSDAFKSRCSNMWIPAPSKEDLEQIIQERYQNVLSKSDIEDLVEAHIGVASLSESGQVGLDQGGLVYSLRNLFRVAERFAYLKDKLGVSGRRVLRREFEDIYLKQLSSSQERLMVREVIDQSFKYIQVEDPDFFPFYVGEESFTIGDLVVDRYQKSEHPLVPDLDQLQLVMTERTKHALYNLVKALEFGERENVALVGERACGKTVLVEYYAALKRQPFYRQVFSEKTDNMELIGMYTPDGWKDGQLLRAGRMGQVPGIFLADEFNQVSDAVTERLNSLLDQDRKLVLSERGGEEVAFDTRFRFVAAFNPPKQNYAGRTKLSSAMLSRLTVQQVPDLESKSEYIEIFTQIAHKRGIPVSVVKALVELHFWVKQTSECGRFEEEELIRGEVFSIRQLFHALDSIQELAVDKGSFAGVFSLASKLFYESVFKLEQTKNKIAAKAFELSR